MRNGGRTVVLAAAVFGAGLALGLLARRRPGPFDTLFLQHPRDMGESYGRHMETAFDVGARLMGAGAACFVHGLVPGLFTNRASRTIAELHERVIVARRSQPHG